MMMIIMFLLFIFQNLSLMIAMMIIGMMIPKVGSGIVVAVAVVTCGVLLMLTITSLIQIGRQGCFRRLGTH